VDCPLTKSPTSTHATLRQLLGAASTARRHRGRCIHWSQNGPFLSSWHTCAATTCRWMGKPSGCSPLHVNVPASPRRVDTAKTISPSFCALCDANAIVLWCGMERKSMPCREQRIVAPPPPPRGGQCPRGAVVNSHLFEMNTVGVDAAVWCAGL
jgi:hypothetical protein